MKTERRDQKDVTEQKAFVLFKQETITGEEFIRQRGLGLGAANGKEGSRKIRVSLANTMSGDKNVFFPPGIRQVPFTWEFYVLFQGRRAGRGGQSDFSTSAIFKFLQRKIFNMPYFGGSMY